MLGKCMLLSLCLLCGLLMPQGEVRSRGIPQQQKVEMANAALWKLVSSQQQHQNQRAYLVSKMQEIMANGADINCRDEKNYTSLHRTVDAEMAAVLIEFGADVNAKQTIGITPLHYSAHLRLRNGKIDMLKDAEIESALKKVEVLLENNADINAETEHGVTPLQFILGDYSEKASAYLPMIDLLAKNDANINDVGYDGDTFLHKAVMFSHKDIVKMLVEHKANVNAVNKEGWTPLHLAIGRSTKEGNSWLHRHVGQSIDDETNTEIINLLITNGADFDIKDSYGKTVLDYYRLFDVPKIEVFERL